MNHPSDEDVLAFLDGTADDVTREAVLAAIERDPNIAARFRRAAAGHSAVDAWADEGVAATTSTRRGRRGRTVPVWWVPAAAAAVLLVALPLGRATAGGATPERVVGVPVDTDPSFVIILQGTWPDAGSLTVEERMQRASEYWGWAERLADDARLVAAGDLAWEAGRSLTSPSGLASSTGPAAGPDLVVGMFTVRAGDYDEALEIARACPHLGYGGSVSVRRVSMGFVTVPGMDDWSS